MRLLKRIRINWLENDNDVEVTTGFISVYDNGVIYMSVDLAQHIGDVKWVKIGLDESKSIMVIKPSDIPINSYPVSKYQNTKIITGVPKLNVQKLKATTYRSDDSLIAVLA